MAFNFMAALGGAAARGSKIIQAKREQKVSDDKTAQQRQWIIESEQRKYATDKKERLDIKAERAEELISTMVALGVPLEAAKNVAQGGVGAAQEAIANIKTGRANGNNTSGYYTMTTPVTAGEIGEISSRPSLVVDTESINLQYGILNSKVKDHNEMILMLSQKQLDLNLGTVEGQKEFDVIETRKDKFLIDISNIANAEGGSGGADARTFGTSTVSRHIASHRNRHLGEFEASVNIETGANLGMDGKKFEVNIADLRAVNSLKGGTKPVSDPFMISEINVLERDAVLNLQNYAAGLMGGDDFVYANEFSSKENFRNDTINDQNVGPKNIGGIFTYRLKNSKVQVMYIGVPGNEYVPLGAVPLT